MPIYCIRILYMNYWKSTVNKHGDSAKLLGFVLQIERVRILCVTDQLFAQGTNTSILMYVPCSL